MSATKKIQYLISKNRLKEAAQELSNSPLREKGISLLRRINDLNERVNSGILSNDEIKIEKNQISEAIQKTAKLLETPNIGSSLEEIEEKKSLEIRKKFIKSTLLASNAILLIVIALLTYKHLEKSYPEKSASKDQTEILSGEIIEESEATTEVEVNRPTDSGSKRTPFLKVPKSEKDLKVLPHSTINTCIDSIQQKLNSYEIGGFLLSPSDGIIDSLIVTLTTRYPPKEYSDTTDRRGYFYMQVMSYENIIGEPVIISCWKGNSFIGYARGNYNQTLQKLIITK